MVFQGQIRNGVVVLDEPVDLPEGAIVRVEVLPITPVDDSQHAPRKGGQWKGQVVISSDFDNLPDDLAEAFGVASR